MVWFGSESEHHQLPSHEHGAHEHTAFPGSCRHATAVVRPVPPRDGPIVPSNCGTHLTCKPIHPNRPDPWTSWSLYAGEWFTSIGIALAGTAVVVGGCIYGKVVIDRNRKKRRDARLEAEGKRPPSENGGDSDGSDDDDLRGQRG